MSVSISTLDSMNYCYFPITKSHIKLRVKANHDARISLRTHLGDDSNVYEIILGAWGNTMSAIRRNNVEPDVAEAETIDICGDNCNIWIQWSCDGFSTTWGATGEWTIMNEYKFTSRAIRQQLTDTCHLWFDFNNTLNFPLNAAMASEDGLYIGRAHHKDSVTPGGIKNNVCTLAWGGTTHDKKEFQVLCIKNIHWVKSWEGSVPLYALPAGETEDGCALFIGRVLHEGVYYVGKIQPNHQVCYIPVNGQEMPCLEYETLIIHNYIIEHIGR
ncbi:uncharacterized protein LOC124952160 isoform X2 [Vespa velutina]|uniref:uncharacterized protein LOC124952160 isoform X2 n=1 Tax=Vespa velutina TaxID=202808 RepID=UPI001FB38634|nr:uncharacterized protein LOC124952160 isoform X2 [Vespa velutina]